MSEIVQFYKKLELKLQNGKKSFKKLFWKSGKSLVLILIQIKVGIIV